MSGKSRAKLPATILVFFIYSFCCDLVFAQAPKDSLWLKFVATGQLALTNYVARVILGMGVLETLGFLENQTLFFALGSSFVFSLCAVLFSFFWRKRFDRGPLEWVMRRLTALP